MTKQEIEQIKKEAQEIIKNKNIIFPLFDLKARWKDEYEYEDFNEYKNVVKNLVKEQNYELVSLTKTFSLTLKGKFATYCIKLNRSSATISVVKGDNYEK